MDDGESTHSSSPVKVRDPSLDLRDFAVSFGNEPVLVPQNLSFEVGITVITGANGSGKSTLLRVAAGELAPSAGAVFCDSRQVSEVARRIRFSYLPQNPQLPGKLRVGGLLQYALWLRGMAPEDIAGRVDHLLHEAKLEARRQDRIAKLSVGMRQRVALAAYLCDPGPVMLLDEPATALDEEAQATLHAALGVLGSETIIVVASHDPHDIEGLAGRVLEVRGGRVQRRSREDRTRG